TLRFKTLSSMSGTTTAYTLNGGTISIDFGVSLASGRTFVLNNVAGNQIEATPGNTVIINGVVSGAGGFTKVGTGLLSLAGTNTYSGATAVTAGTLQIAADASLGTAPSSATVNQLVINGGTLATTTGTSFAVNATRGIGLGAGANVINVNGQG